MARLITGALVLLIRLYQYTVSPLLRPCCRFHPSCSRYMVEALRRKGLVKGLSLGVVRILKCHPFHPRDYDPVE